MIRPNGCVARSRRVARSGIRPTYQNRSETVRVGRDREDVPDQRAAPLRPERHRVGIRHQPVEEPGAAHVQERKQPRAGDGEQRHRLGEPVDRRPPLLLQQQQDRRDQACPAWPIPIHQTKLTIANPHITGLVDAPDPDAPEEQVGDRDRQQHQQAEGRARTRRTSRQLKGRVRTIALILSVTEPNVCPAPSTGAGWSSAAPGPRRSDAIVRLRLELGVRVPQLGQVGRPRPGVQLGEHAVVPRVGLQLRDLARRCRSCRRRRSPASGRPPGRRSRPRRRGSAGPRSPPCTAPALIRWTQYVHFSITPARPHRHVGVVQQRQARRRLVGVLEEVEVPDLVRAVVRSSTACRRSGCRPCC